ncbi:GntR family transcriptional regulator [Alkalibacillus salilacus]|uniref:DNA-binding GntR family transcriptional regulator n=1 Tax=Alkalibacillus salilacus TaxID=284582 RepID=A0ABT9VFW6_9BACI|nr:GntR family transcriptional regulator [Alkalibacillus salilacus]MDQ0159861.1 DNA-binding GntR family transcriptional regulator [Alkalibacillus salilacus]
MFNHQSEHGDYFRESLPQSISKEILRKIMKGELVSGDKIVEENIASELETSRAPVREALYLLQVNGIVDRIPRKGTIVKSFTRDDISDYVEVMIHIIQYGIVGVSKVWNDTHKEKWQQLYEDVLTYYGLQDLIHYQHSAELMLRYVMVLADNKALMRFYDEANQILNVFAQVQWNQETMIQFHKQFAKFVEALAEVNFEEAKQFARYALKEGEV